MTMTAARGALVRALRRPWKTIVLLTVYPNTDKCPQQSMEAADRAFRDLHVPLAQISQKRRSERL